ncbi:PIN domain-containing protein [Candidatus Woesearchaeota archaeon]|nr:PIN domain-containing protein [Candidatus Woesearchaeota archaeon]
MKYYVDTSIWLNLFKKEGDRARGVPYWQLAKEFLERVLFSKDDALVYSGIVLRELQIKLGEPTYQEKKRWFEEEPKFLKVEVVNEDKIAARKLESHYDFEISFYDLLHTVLAKRLGLALVTRDEQLLKIAKENGVQAAKPEEL